MKDGNITMDNGHQNITLTMYEAEKSDEYSVLETRSICTSNKTLGEKLKKEDLELETLLNLEPPDPGSHIPETDTGDINISSLFKEEEEDLVTSKVKEKPALRENISKHKAVWQPVRKTNPTIAPCYSVSNFADKEIRATKRPYLTLHVLLQKHGHRC